MGFDPDIHRRRSIRLKDYDYATPGAYYVSICTHERECLFGDIVEGVMRLNDAGWMVQKCWDALPDHCPHVELDAFVVMPNHVHGIIVINTLGFDQNVGAQFIAPGPAVKDNQAKSDKQGAKNQVFCQNVGAQFIAPGPAAPMNQGAMNRAPTVGKIVRRLKARCTHDINHTRNAPGTPVWQRNYYERVIRDDKEWFGIREYINHNPAQWDQDTNNPNNVP